MINGSTYIGTHVQSFLRGDAILPVTHVIVNYGKNDDGKTLSVEAKKTPDDGRLIEKTLETITDAWNAQNIADLILYQYTDDSYEPISFSSGELDPAAEVGDAITVNDVYTMIGSISTIFNQYIFAGVESPGIQQVKNSLFDYKPKSERKVERDYAKSYAAIKANANQIELVVERENEVEGRVENVSTTITQTADEINATVEAQRATLEASINSERVRIDGVITNLDNHATQQARFIEYSTAEGLILGAGSSKKKAQLTESELDFYNPSGNVAASIGTDGFYINGGHIVNELEIGDHWSLIASSDNHLTIKWRS